MMSGGNVNQEMLGLAEQTVPAVGTRNTGKRATAESTSSRLLKPETLSRLSIACPIARVLP